MAAPPPLWQHELTLGRPDQVRPAPLGGGRLGGAADGDEKLSETWRHVKGVARDEAKHYDLIDLVRNARREDTFQFPVPGWPSLLRAVSPAMPDLPAMVQEKYRACQTMCFCGVFPEIRRAWASVDNSLFLWRYDRSGDVPVEYSGEEQAICCVGLARPRPGVFLAAIQHVLVLATTVEVRRQPPAQPPPTPRPRARRARGRARAHAAPARRGRRQIVLLGVCTGPSRVGGGDAYEELSLQPMPLYSLPSDNTIMTCFASSAAGRIFLGGADGHVYELAYAASDSWRQRRCTKVRVTGGVAQLLPSFLPSFLFGAPVPMDRLALDDERHILYALAANSAIQVFDLGASGGEPARRVAELTDFLGEVSRLPTGRNVFTLGEDRRGTAIKHMAIIPMAESWKVHLMVVTSNGRRAYFSTNPLVRGGGSSWAGARDSARGGGGVPSHLDPKRARPAALIAVDARGPLPQAPIAGARVAGDPSSSRVMDVAAVLYTPGSLLLAESAGADGKATKLLLAARNHTLPPPSVNVNLGSGAAGLREIVSDLEQHVPGEATAIGCLPQTCVLGPEVAPAGSWGAMQDELVGQMWMGPLQLVLVTTAGVLELERRRPVDVLQALLQARRRAGAARRWPSTTAARSARAADGGRLTAAAPATAAAAAQERAPEKLQQFFEAYGAAEAAAMCYLLATADGVSMRLVEEAAAALDNPLLVGQPLMPEEGGGGAEAALNAGAAGGGIYMGTAVNPNPEPDWSGAHKGLALYISRLLAPVWEARLITPSAANPDVWKARLSEATMAVLEHKLRALERFLADAAARRKARGFKAAGGAAPGGGGGGGALFLGHLEDGTSRLLNAGNAAAGAAAATGGAAGGLAPGGGDAPFVKRQRLWNAFVMEEQRNNAVRLLASKAAQALLLLRTISAANVNRLVNRLDADGRRALRDLNFRDLVLEASGPGLAAQLVAALVADQLDAGGGGGAGGVAELAAALQAGAPGYFRDQDRQFFQATAKLKAAEEAGSAAERDAAARDALAGLLRVPQCVNLGQLVPRLAFLRQYEGVVELVLRCAALADPHSLAWRHGSSADTAAARAARDRCYAHLLGVLKPLLGVGPPPTGAPTGAAAAAAGAGGAGAGAEAEGALLTPAERGAAKDAMMQAVLRCGDQYLTTVIYGTLVDCGLDDDLLAHPSPALELYLRAEGGLGGGAGGGGLGGGGPGAGLGGGAVGPLSSRQVKHLELLARLHIQKGKYAAAAGVYRALAERRSGPGDAAVSLEQRLDALHSALLQARSVGDEALTEGLRGAARVMALQLSIATALEGRLAALRAGGAPGGGSASGGRDGLEAAVRELRSAALDISDLYNSYAQPHELWDACLEICHFAGNVPAEYVRQLWDLLLKATWEASSPGGGADAALERCCDVVEALGVKFYPNEGSLPLAHVTLRLEAVSAGLWPAPGDAATDPSRVVACLRALLAPGAGDNASAVVAGVYEQLLARRGALLDGGVAGAGVVLGGAGDGAARAALRLGLLRSLVAHCRIVLDEELSSSLTGQPDHGYPSRFLGRAQQAAALADLSERCAAEARGLGGDAAAAGAALADEFDRVAAQLAGGGGWR
ncbi:NUP155 [Scenedesmus sp. PABB004]|nr:NUP155 [Scenedesmus sp. PABB004]